MFKAVFVVAALIVGFASVYIFKKPHENPIEESTEVFIKDLTGFDIDITPTSEENNENISK
jgi:hypothetical protein